VTPLWFYALAEAAHRNSEPGHSDDHRLGPVGSTIVAEVLIGLVWRSEDSILSTAGWTPSLPAKNPGEFDLADLLRFAGVLAGGAAPQTYVVVSATRCSPSRRKSSATATAGRRSSRPTEPSSAGSTRSSRGRG
jgi:hypothetical protein